MSLFSFLFRVCHFIQKRWLKVVLFSFAIGNARPFNLQERYLDHCSRILAHPNATFEDGKVVAEIQLYATTLKLQSDTQRMRFAECEYEEIERWKMEWAHLLSKFCLSPFFPPRDLD